MWEASCWSFGRKNNARIKSMCARVFHALVRIPLRRRMQEPLLLTERFFLSDKLVFSAPNIRCHCETSAHTGRGNPPVSGEIYRIVPVRVEVAAVFGVNRSLFLSTGGLPHQRARWFAMTVLFQRDKHQFTVLFSPIIHSFLRNDRG